MLYATGEVRAFFIKSDKTPRSNTVEWKVIYFKYDSRDDEIENKIKTGIIIARSLLAFFSISRDYLKIKYKYWSAPLIDDTKSSYRSICILSDIYNNIMEGRNGI